MSEDTQVNGGDHEDGAKETLGSESKNTQATKKASSANQVDDSEGNDNATAFDELLLDIDKDRPNPQSTTEIRDANFNKSKQIEVWFNRIKDGDTNPKTDEQYSLEEAPPWVADDIDFQRLKREIPELPKSKQEALASKFREFKSAGIKSDYFALKNALEFVRVSTESEKRGAKAARMKVANGGSSGGVNSKDSNIPSNEYLKRSGITADQAKKLKNFNFLNPSSNV